MWCRGSCSPELLLETFGPLFFHTMTKGSKTNMAVRSQKQNLVLTKNQLRMRALRLHHNTWEKRLHNEIFGTVLMSKYGCLVTPFRWLNSFSGTKIIIFVINNHVLHIWNQLQQSTTKSRWTLLLLGSFSFFWSPLKFWLPSCTVAPKS